MRHPASSLARRSTSRVVLAFVIVALVAYPLVAYCLPFLVQRLSDGDIAEVCGRSFERGDVLAKSQVLAQFGPLHKVGESRRGETLLAVSATWPSNCKGATPTLLFSNQRDRLQVWALRGGP